MSKLMIIFDDTESCDKCKICVAVLGKRYCPAKGTTISKGERDCSCPAVAVPDEMDPAKARGAYDTAYTEGWNAFRRKILGGTNE